MGSAVETNESGGWNLEVLGMDPVNETENAMVSIAVRICVLSTEFTDYGHEGILDPDTGERDFTAKPTRRPIPVEEQKAKAETIRILAEANKELACGLTMYLRSDIASYCDKDSGSAIKAD